MVLILCLEFSQFPTLFLSFWLLTGSISWMLIPLLPAVCPLPPVSFQGNISSKHLFCSLWFRGVTGLSLWYPLSPYLMLFNVFRAWKFSDWEWAQTALLPEVCKPQGVWRFESSLRKKKLFWSVISCLFRLMHSCLARHFYSFYFPAVLSPP